MLGFAVPQFILVACVCFALPFLELAATRLLRAASSRSNGLQCIKQQPAGPSGLSQRAMAVPEILSGWSIPNCLLLGLFVAYNALAFLAPLYYYDVHDIYW